MSRPRHKFYEALVKATEKGRVKWDKGGNGHRVAYIGDGVVLIREESDKTNIKAMYINGEAAEEWQADHYLWELVTKQHFSMLEELTDWLERFA